MNGHETSNASPGMLLLVAIALAWLLDGAFPPAPRQESEAQTSAPFTTLAPVSREQWAAPAGAAGRPAADIQQARPMRWVF